MSPTSVRKTQLLYQTVVQQLESKLLQLQSRRESMDDRAFVVVNEELTSCRSHSPDITTDGVNDQSDLYYGEVGSLVSTATDIIIKALEIKLSYVRSVLERLSLLVSDNPRQATPTELSFSHYEEWLDSNQQLFEFNSQLYELERVKFDLKKKQERVKQAGKGLAMPGDFDSSSVGQLAYRQAQVLLTKFQNQHAHSSHTTRVYIHELLNPRGGKTTLESEKVREYVAQCFQYANADINEVKGIHSESYQEFMAVLCSYIVEKQRERQREDVSSELVYSAVERCLMPQLKTLILSRVSQRERDDIINEKCHAFSNVTMDQLRVRPQLQSNEPVPFIESITQLRASYFSSTPTDKMYSVVAAVKALYDQLGYLGESSVDGDAFLDLWIYVIIKANVKDLATNLRFMTEYGNPQLANGEAGYYLTTLEAAVEFITTLTPQLLQSPRGEMEFVVCERAHFMSLCSMPGSGMELVTKETEVQGYRIAVLKDWALNRARLFRSALVPTANYSDSAKVAVIRVKQENTNPAITQYLLKQLRCVELTERGLFSKSIPLGIGIFINMTSVDHHSVIVLPTGDYDHHISDLRHILQLQRLDSLSHDPGEQDSCLIYSPSPSRSQTLNLPVSSPYHSIMIQDSSQVEGHVGESFPAGRCGRMERESGHSHRPLWSPYVLSQNPSPEQDNRVCEATFIHQVIVTLATTNLWSDNG